MDWVESIRNIRKLRDENRLVIFVGAGVSRNSGLPSWSELIKKIANEINYSRCDYCTNRKDSCMEKKCDFCEDYSYDEFLKIPEYYYDLDDSNKKKNYFRFIKKEMDKSGNSNSLDKIIVDILPHHIITTNYDFLLEKSNSINTKRYKVVQEDKQLLADQNNHYLIKMHGSLDDMRTIVLKESDYIDYENNHPLICTMIKALLLDHSFLFLGYSLNDYNLKLIMGWINYFRKDYEVSGIKHYLFTSDENNEYEKRRLEENNVIVINGNDVTHEIIEDSNVPDDLYHPIAQKMYSYLKCIMDSDLWKKVFGIRGIIDDIYYLYISYRKIALVDIKSVLPMGSVKLYDTTLVFYDKNFYNSYKEELKTNIKLQDIFRRTHIFGIQFYFDADSFYEYPNNKFDRSELFSSALMNDYKKVFSIVCNGKKHDESIYFYKLLNLNKKLQEVLRKKESFKDYIDYIFMRMRQRISLISPNNRQYELTKELREIFNDKQFEYSKCIFQLEDLLSVNSQDVNKMKDLLRKTEERYGIGFDGLKTDGTYIEIQELQGYAYNYYYFIKLNYLPLDTYPDPEIYFEPYIKAMLCSYFKCKQSIIQIFYTQRKEYILNDIDYDIITKYTNPKSLVEWIRQYSVKGINIDEELANNIYITFDNLCKSFLKFKTDIFLRYIYSSVILISNIHNIDKGKIINSFYPMFRSMICESSFSIKLMDILGYILKNNFELDKRTKNKILLLMLKDSVYNFFMKNSNGIYDKVINSLSDSIGYNKSKSLFENILSDNDMVKMFHLRKLLPLHKVNSYFEKNIVNYSIEQITIMFFERRLKFTNQIQQIYVDAIERNRLNKGLKIFPDYYNMYINDFLLLDLLGYDIELTLISKYQSDSDFVKFVIHPEEFDYSLVDIRNYMWQNYIYSDKYKHYFIKHKSELLDEEIRGLFLSNRADIEQQKVVYGILLEDKELRRFP